jgi:hypothetical protein
MRFWLDRDWPVGQWLLPRGVVVDWAATDDQWSTIAKGLTPPPDAIPLDAEAEAAMKHYEFNGQRPSPATPDHQ